MSVDWSEAKVLVVGGAGFVGGNLTRALLNAGVKEVLIIDNLLSSEPDNLPKSSRLVFWEGSITDEIILEKISDNFDYIFHLATYHGNQSSIHDPLADHENNLVTTLKLFNRVKDFKTVRKVVYSGAGCAVAKKTFGEARATEEDDSVSFDMDSPYSISKLVGEFYAVYFHKQHGLPTVRARFQNVYGPGEVLGAGRWRGTPATVWRNVIPTFIYRAIKRMPLIVENEGLATRDFIYVDDVVQGLLLCAENGVPGEVYNLGSGRETSILELARLINELTKNPTPIEFGPKRDWDRSGRRFGSTEKAKQEIGFSAGEDLVDGLLETVQWTYQNLDFIDACIKKHNRYMMRDT
ncbi:MAG: NAD-dependent epimerase/dehydratase family protein [candidate division Zixibacteria bacterium]|nr:NAD-dependent epimerase/dehydratase family protein [candidate division Zixibacteria bacterium]